ncbi:MAG: TadE/TadG family type IV pilus assembly protein, partial [Jannaschia sp.]
MSLISNTFARRVSGPLLKARFSRDEDGALTIFGLLIFVMMMMAAGLALDLMRSEAQRAQLQNTIDRAVLAAASLDQTRDPTTVVEDYLRAAGIDNSSVTITSTDDGRTKRVMIEANSTVNSLFMNVLGHDTITTPVSSSAREEETELEVSLVLDISGSMGGTKISNLRAAASSFVAELLDGREALTSISIVPYNDRVNVGSLVSRYFPLTTEHTHSDCVVFADADFLTTGLAAGTILQRMGHFDRVSSTDDGNGSGLVARPNCRTDDYGAILPWSNTVADLQASINSLGASDWTAMDLGVKWGALMLDPSSRDEMAAMIGDGIVDPIFAGRPSDFGTNGSRKVMVVMTDGVNTTQWDLKPSRKGGPSGMFVYRPGMATPGNGGAAEPTPAIFRNGRSNWSANWSSQSAFVTGAPATADDAWWLHGSRGNWVSFDNGANGDTNGNGVANDNETYYSTWSPNKNAFWISHRNRYEAQPYGGTAAVELSYPEVFASMSINYLNGSLLSGADSNMRNRFRQAWTTTHGQTEADANLAAICTAARNAGIIIYTIAFQAPQDGQNAMRNCAGLSNAGNFLNVSTTDIESAFDDILASINRLKLV